MPKYFVIVNENTGNLDDGHLCYCSNDADMDTWEVEPGYRLIEVTGEEHRALGLYDIIGTRDGKQVVLDAKNLRPEDNPHGERKYKLDMQKLERNVADRPRVAVPIEAEGIGGKEIIGYEEKPESVITERKKEVIDIKHK